MREIIDLLKKYTDGKKNTEKVEVSVLNLNRIIKAIKKARWIPVSERLPEEYKRVIVSDVVGIYIGEFIDAEENWGGKHFINEHGMRSKSAKAWMPLPELYKAESEDKA